MRDKVYEGIVIKVTEKNIVLMCNNGTFKNIPRKVSEVPVLGQRLTFAERQRSINLFKYASVASAFALALILYIILPFGAKDTAYIVALDINPSIEIALNEDLKVNDLIGVNNDGHKLIQVLEQVKNQHISKAIEQIIETANGEGYIKIQKALVSVTVISLEEGLEPIVKEIEKELDLSLKNIGLQNFYTVAEGNKELYQKAKELKLSVNQMTMYKRLHDLAIVESPDEIRNKTIFQLKEMEEGLVDNKKAAQQSPTKENTGLENVQEVKNNESAKKETEYDNEQEEEKQEEVNNRPEENKQKDVNNRVKDKETEVNNQPEENKEAKVNNQLEGNNQPEVNNQPEEETQTEINNQSDQYKYDLSNNNDAAETNNQDSSNDQQKGGGVPGR